jgi:hypothetical protein
MYVLIIGSLSAREADGRTNISAGEKVLVSYMYLCVLWINMLFLLLLCGIVIQ